MTDTPLKDYYAILGVNRHSSQEEIKAAYRLMSKKWHPDLNPDVDVTHVMQDINEAYAILKDNIKKTRYDKEYDSYFTNNKYQYSYTESYSIHDEELKNDIKEAREYAKDLVSEFLANLKDSSQKAMKGAWNESKGYVYLLILSIVISLLVMTCSE